MRVLALRAAWVLQLERVRVCVCLCVCACVCVCVCVISRILMRERGRDPLTFIKFWNCVQTRSSDQRRWSPKNAPAVA